MNVMFSHYMVNVCFKRNELIFDEICLTLSCRFEWIADDYWKFYSENGGNDT